MHKLARVLACATVAASLCGSVAAAQVVFLRLDDTIHPAAEAFVERALSEAERLDAALVVLELDTPGGLLDSTREMITAITGCKVPVVVYVAPAGARAASAGFFLLMASDLAAMAPGTNTGAAHPVLMPLIPQQQETPPSDDMMTKVTNDASAMIRSLAEPRGRNVDLAVKAVTESLSFTAQEALEDNLIEVVAGSLDELLDTLDGREIRRFDSTTVSLDLAQRTVVVVEPSAKEQLQSLLANPVIAFFLFAIASIGIYTEITHPGALLPGVVGVIALLLFLYSTSVLPVNWIGLALILVALVLFILEVKVTSYGFLTLGGLICFVLGSLMLFDAPIPDMRLSLGVVLPTALVVAAVMIFFLQRIIKAHRKRPVTGSEGLVGEIGQAVSELAPAGKVKVHGEWWDARTRGPAIAAGSEVRVLAIRGRQIEVEAASEPEGES